MKKKLHPADTWGSKSVTGLQAHPCSWQTPPFFSFHHFLCAFCGTAARNRCNRGCGACDGDWRAEPQSLSCSEGSQSGPALPQHPLRLSIQAVWTTESAQWQRTGLLTVHSVVYNDGTQVLTNVNCGYVFSFKDVEDSGRKYQLELSVQEIISNVRWLFLKATYVSTYCIYSWALQSRVSKV